MSWWQARRCQQCQDMGREIIRLKRMISDAAAILTPMRLMMNDGTRALLDDMRDCGYGGPVKGKSLEDLRK